MRNETIVDSEQRRNGLKISSRGLGVQSLLWEALSFGKKVCEKFETD